MQKVLTVHCTMSFNYQKADDKIFVCKFSKNVKSKLYHIEKANNVDLDEVAHDELPHQDLWCLQIQLLASLVLKEFKRLALTGGIRYPGIFTKRVTVAVLFLFVKQQDADDFSG